MREASRIVRAALIVASHALAPELWPATRTATLCRPRGMGDCDGAPAIFVAPGAPVSGATKFQALPVPVGRDAALMMEKAMRGEVFGKVQTLTIAQGAAAAWIFRGDESRRGRGRGVDSPWRRVAATLRPRRG